MTLSRPGYRGSSNRCEDGAIMPPPNTFQALKWASFGGNSTGLAGSSLQEHQGGARSLGIVIRRRRSTTLDPVFVSHHILEFTIRVS
ncbi:MAG: hypothetical protein K0Q68_285 [Moraxellaceae bacterium]|nr:hypothetical protein [Moraxellaceae bacterium]